jgi:hypothetical protein
MMVFTGEPAWFLILCLLIAAGYAAALYFREKRTEMSAALRSALAAIRFLAVFLIAFLLLSPFVRTITRGREKPLIIIAQDNSGSVALNPDSAYYRGEYLQALDELSIDLSYNFEVKRMTFGENADALQQEQSFKGSVTFSEKLTSISDLFSDISSLYANRNLGAVILASDGIYNAGYNPVYPAAKSACPIYSISLGDTVRRKDLVISHVNYNRVVYLNNKFPLQVTLQSHDCEGSRTLLEVTGNGRQLYSQEMVIDKSDFSATVNILLDAHETGLKRYRVSLNPLEGELNTDNNSRDLFIEVLDARTRILILYQSPHPDIAALRNAAETNLNYEVEDYSVSDFTGRLEAFNMVILHQLPSKDNAASAIISEIKEKEIPALFILGTQSDLVRFNDAQGFLKIVSTRNLFEETLPSYSQGFGLFMLDPESTRLMNSFPPLNSPSGDYKTGNMSNVLFKQRIGTVQTSRPMILLSQNLQYRNGVITGEGIWRWRMMNYSMAGNQNAFNELFNKIFQYLSLKEQKQNLRVYHKSSFPEYERVQFDAEVYNRNYELVNEPELEISISDEEGKQYPFTFSKALNSYRLDAGRFNPGNYSWQASVRVGEESFSASGQFSVTRVDLESLSLVADHSLLAAISSQSGGKRFLPLQMARIKDEVLSNQDIKPIIYTRKRINDLVNIPWLLASIIALLAVEWFIRKRSGSY